jgi:hypothetical protein
MNLDEARKKLYAKNMQMLGFDAPAKTAPVVAVAPKKAAPKPAKKSAAKEFVSGEIQGPPDEHNDLIRQLSAVQEQQPETIEELPVQQEEIEREPSSKGMDAQSAQYIGDLAAAAGPALISTLFGGSSKTNSELFDKGNQYLMNRGKQEEVTKDKISVIDDNGEPLNIRTRDALGKKPYYQSKLGKYGGTGKAFAPIEVKHIDTGEILPAKVTGDGYVNAETGEMLGNKWLRFKSDDLIKEKTMQGGSQVTARNKYTGKLAGVTAQQGLGDRLGGISKEEAVSAIKQSEKGRTESIKPLEQYNNAKFAFDSLSSTNLTAEKGAAAMTILAKAINKDKVSDADFVHLKGDEFKTYIRKFEEWADGRLQGQVPPQAVQAFREIAKEIMRMKQVEIEGVKNATTPRNLPTQGQKIIDDMTGIKPAAPKSNDWKNEMKGMGR